jgi:hypothetical protein
MNGDRDDRPTPEPDVLKRNLLTSLHRNTALHLSANRQKHEIGENHNCVTLFFFMKAELPDVPDDSDDHCCVQEVKLFHYTPLTYDQWLTLVNKEHKKYPQRPKGNFICFYGWRTYHLPVTPIRNGDIWIKVDNEGVRHVCFSFGQRKIHRDNKDEKKRANN